MEITELTKKLISIPSWVGIGSNEKEIGLFVYSYLKKISWLTVKKQKVDQNRFNILAYGSKKPKVLITGHLDTVQPTKAWNINPIKPFKKNGLIYGLGSSDMKGSLAGILMAIKKIKPNQELMFLFYCDEEYDFLGMKRFIREYQDKIKPKLIVSGDGGNLQVGNSCRGLIELTADISGKSGHAANPKSGVNAITQSLLVIKKMERWLRQYQSSELGCSTINIAYFKGGTKIDQKDDQVALGQEGNVIPDYCQYIIEIRNANNLLDANKTAAFIKKESKRVGLKVNKITIRHNLESWITAQKELKMILEIAPKKKLVDAKKRGYIDIQMLWEAFNKVPTFTFGPGEPKAAHQADEYVKTSSLTTSEKFFVDLLNLKW